LNPEVKPTPEPVKPAPETKKTTFKIKHTSKIDPEEFLPALYMDFPYHGAGETFIEYFKTMSFEAQERAINNAHKTGILDISSFE
jgi:hypothetical protein